MSGLEGAVAGPEGIRVLVWSADADERFLDQLAVHLAPLSREGRIDLWTPRRIGVGESVTDVTRRAFESAQLVVPLVSKDLLASDAYWAEIERVLDQNATREVQVLPVLVAPCTVKGTVLDGLRMLPASGKAVACHAVADEAWQEVMHELWRRLSALTPTPAPVPVSPGADPSDNPFEAWSPAPSSRFVGRAALLRELWDDADAMRSVSIVGDSRIGKTSLLMQLAALAASRGWMVRFVGEREVEQPTAGALVTAITGMPAPDDPDGAADVLRAWTDEATGPMRPFVVLDHMDKVVRQVPADFFERLRPHVQERRMMMIFASRQELDRLFEERQLTSPFTGTLPIRWMGLLEPESADAIVERGAARWQPGDREILREWAGRHPYFLQLFAWHLWRARDDGDAIEDARRKALAEAWERIRKITCGLDAGEQKVLRDVLKGGARSETRSFVRLVQRGLLTEDGKPFGRVLPAALEQG